MIAAQGTAHHVPPMEEDAGHVLAAEDVAEVMVGALGKTAQISPLGESILSSRDSGAETAAEPSQSAGSLITAASNDLSEAPRSEDLLKRRGSRILNGCK